MENVTLEELQKQIAALQDKLDRVDDYRKIMNVYSKFWHYYEMGKYEERFDLIAHHTPGVTVEIGARGVFEGRESAHRSLVDTELGFEHSHAVGMKRLFPDVDFPSEHAGMLESTLIGSPIIEIAEDRKTAHGVFIALQSVAKTHDNDPKPRSMWIWWKTAIDFVNEDGIWRIWHFNNNPCYATGSTEDWVTNAVHMAGLRMPDDPEDYVPSGGPGGPAPKKNAEKGNQTGGHSHYTTADRPTTSFYRSYRITALPLEIPLPEPYKTFDESFSYEPEKS